jgi:hypothetical protein
LLPGLAVAEDKDTLSQEKWAVGVSAYTFVVPGGDDYVQPTLTADRGAFHFEARHNYEALDTSSAWLGWNYSVGESVQLALTPMVGVVAGKTDGWAPGYKATLIWQALTAYSEGEYVFDRHNDADSFFYCWNELTLSPVEWLRFGLVSQRTRAYTGERSTQRGLLVGATYKQVGVTAHVFNPDQDDVTYALSVTLAF